MHIRSLLVGALVVAATASEGQASGVSRAIRPDCTTGSLITCASVRVKFNHVDPASSAKLAIGDFNTSFNKPFILSTWHSDGGRERECRPGGADCREVPATVTPEPVTMTLLATGLVGLGGIGGIRRRLNSRNKETQLS